MGKAPDFLNQSSFSSPQTVGREYQIKKTNCLIQSMIFSKKNVRTTSIPKIRNIHSGVWKLQAKNSKIGLKWTNRYFMAKNSPYQNFPGKQSMIFSKRTIRTTSIPKIRKIHSGVWKLQAKNSKNCQFWPKNGQIWS